MINLPEGVIKFFNSQRFSIVSTIDKDGSPHNACKGMVDIEKDGRVYLLDLYRGKTFENLARNSSISVTAVDEHKFAGYCLKGKARMLDKEKIESRIIKLWEKKITGRISHRLLKNIKEEKGHVSHPEALLPKPEYMILVDVEEVIDLMPNHIRQAG
ncbi:MAG: pyridoxamine 5'-phosphate oxidase family protein [Candidatus Omnitrophota bacterium]|jgi:uncharacterized pyridoxamine 5'-phosphate oxidase family protein